MTEEEGGLVTARGQVAFPVDYLPFFVAFWRPWFFFFVPREVPLLSDWKSLSLFPCFFFFPA